MVDNRVARGRLTQEITAKWFREHGAPEAKSRPASLPGTDVYDIAGLSIEVKAQPGNVTGALKHAIRNANGGLPMVVWRPNGYGIERLPYWPAIFTLADATQLLRDANYLQEF
jgi:hypothetical protein